ncbi:MAG TPA: zf-HC2 domain-containing protein [Lachnospiraceae bacterium]|nr:zf-HC2 domain-containing protein [Lachnospiraceae bacterium]
MKKRMDCRQAENDVKPYIDGTLTDRECADFISHIRGCPACYEELETYFTIYYALKYLDDDKNRSYNMRKVLDEDLRKNELRIKRNKALSVMFKLMITVSEAMAAFAAVLRFYPEFIQTVLKYLAGIIPAA